jgi:hypothetical protein
MKWFVYYNDGSRGICGFGTEGEAQYFIRKRMEEGPHPNRNPDFYRVFHGIEREVGIMTSRIKVQFGRQVP